MKDKSDTPRSNAAVRPYIGAEQPNLNELNDILDCSRQLERELNEARSVLLEIHAYIVNGSSAWARNVVTEYLQKHGLVLEDGLTHVVHAKQGG